MGVSIFVCVNVGIIICMCVEVLELVTFVFVCELVSMFVCKCLS